MPSAATAASPPHHRTLPGMRTRGIGTAGIDGIVMPPRLAGSCGRSVLACLAGWRGRWPRGRGTWPFAVAPRAPARVVELDDIGSPPDIARPEPTDVHPPVRSLPIALPRLGRWYPAGPDSTKREGPSRFSRLRDGAVSGSGDRPGNPSSCWSLSSLSSQRAGFHADRAQCPRSQGPSGTAPPRPDAGRAERRYMEECGHAGRCES